MTLQTDFEIICILKYMVHRLPYYSADRLATIIEIQKLKTYLHP